MKLTPHLHLVPSSRMRGAKTPLPNTPSRSRAQFKKAHGQLCLLPLILIKPVVTFITEILIHFALRVSVPMIILTAGISHTRTNGLLLVEQRCVPYNAIALCTKSCMVMDSHLFSPRRELFVSEFYRSPS
jgi:hypothetical protein